MDQYGRSRASGICRVVMAAAALAGVAGIVPGAHARAADPVTFLAAARDGAARFSRQSCPVVQPDARGIVRHDPYPHDFGGEAGDTQGGLGYPLFKVTDGGDDSAHPAPGTLRHALNDAQAAGGGWIVFSHDLDGRVIVPQATFRLPSNITLDGGCGQVTLEARARLTDLTVTDSTNIIIRGLKLTKQPYVDKTDKTGDAIGLTGFFDRVAIVHNDFRRCGDGCVDIVRKGRINAASHATVAFNHFQAHNKVMLIGTLTCYITPNAPGCTDPLAHLDEDAMRPWVRVSITGNYFESTSQRHPKVVSNAYVQSVDNVIVLKPTLYPDGKPSASYGVAAATGGVVDARGDMIVNQEPDTKLGVGSITLTRRIGGSTREADGAVNIDDLHLYGPLLAEPFRAELARQMHGASVPTPPASMRPEVLAACVMGLAGAAGGGNQWPRDCGASK